MDSNDRKLGRLVFHLILLSSTFTTAEGQTRPKLRTREDGVARSLGGGRGLRGLGRRPSPGCGPHGTLAGGFEVLGFCRGLAAGVGALVELAQRQGPASAASSSPTHALHRR